MKQFKPKEIEPKWRQIWDETGVYTADLKSSKPKYIAMSMFNYPSGAGIHIGHAMNYTISDVKARFKRQQGFESYHPVGWDAFGLPAENYAINSGVSPQESMASIIPMYHKQYKAMGWSNDWEKEIATHLPEYYKWTQWIFCELYRNGLVYQDARLQWWCPIDKTVLANEQVIDGKCWRHDGPDDPMAQKREIKQWFFKITDYADELLDAIESLDWSESVKLAQKNWIGRSNGAEVNFSVKTNSNYVLLHGYTGSPNSDFHPWLKSEIERSGGKVQVPELPNTENPKVMDQVDYVLKNCTFDENTVLVGHSLGTVVALKVVEQLNLPIKKLVLAASFAQPGFLDHGRPFERTFDWQFDFAKIKNNAKEIVILRDENDSAVPAERADFIASKLNAKIIDFIAEESHICGKREPIVGENVLDQIKVFTTAHDTIYGATFMVLSPEHDLVHRLTKDPQKKEVNEYIDQAEKKSDLERQSEKNKTGVFTGSYAINPINGKEIPIWVADYVLVNYGTGAIMAVPGEDERDYEFAKKYDLDIVYTTKQQEFVSYTDIKAKRSEYKLANSNEFNDLDFKEGRQKILEKLIELKVGSEKVNYRMNDWSVSRQRYWGAPIPIIYCPSCGPQLVPDDQLPVILPALDDFQPSGDGRSALARAEDWLEVDCPKCGGKAERETDTMDTYVDSSWYMYRYLDPHNQEAVFDSELVKKWEPIDFYNGADHATAHLLYARFIARFFTKIGLINEPEPFKHFLFNGKVTASDGTMFSKSKGNGVDPLEIINDGYGADALRTYLMFAAPLDLWIRWDPQGVPGAYRFLNRLWNLVQEYLEGQPVELDDQTVTDIRRAINITIKKATEEIEADRYNTAIAEMMRCVNDFYKLKLKGIGRNDTWQQALEQLVALVAPFAPHTADELWHQLGHSVSVHKDSWPKWDEHYLQTSEVTVVVQINGKLRSQLTMPVDSDEEAVKAAVSNDPKVQQHLNGQQPKKTIFVKNKLINIVI